MFIPPDWDRSARLFLSIGVDRVLCVPCQLWLVGSTGGGEALTGSDRSRRRPGPVHHLSAHAQWVPDSPFNAVCNTGQLQAPSASFFVSWHLFFPPYQHPWVTFRHFHFQHGHFSLFATGTETFPLYKQKIRARQRGDKFKSQPENRDRSIRFTHVVTLLVFTFQRQIHYMKGKRLSKITISVCGNVI